MKILHTIFIIVGLCSNIYSETKMINPNSILYSMPTISGDNIKFVMPDKKDFSKAPQFHEDEWGQLEFYPKTRLEEIKNILIKYKIFEKKHRTKNGWSDIFLRNITKEPVLPNTDLLLSLPNASQIPAPILTTASKPLGQVKNSFSITLGNDLILYGLKNVDKITMLSAYISSENGTNTLKNVFVTLNKKANFIFVDWRSQFVLIDVNKNGDFKIWKP